MKLLTFLALSFFAVGNTIQPQSLNEVVSIINLGNGNFDVLCNNHDREVVTEQDLLNNNVCPHVPAAPNHKMDILFVVDNSGSMATSQQRLASYADEIIADLSTRNIDFQIAVTTTEAYLGLFTDDDSYYAFRSHNGHSILTANTPELAATLAALIPQGTEGSGDERPFLSTVKALEYAPNNGFLRTDAELHMVILTDEDDFSHPEAKWIGDNNDPGLYAISDLYQMITAAQRSVQPFPLLRVSAVGIFDEACRQQMEGNFRGRTMAARISDMVGMTNGEEISICAPTPPTFPYIAH